VEFPHAVITHRLQVPNTHTGEGQHATDDAVRRSVMGVQARQVPRLRNPHG